MTIEISYILIGGNHMNEVNKIRNRIKKHENPRKVNILLRVFNCFLVLLVLGVMSLIYCKQDENGTMLKNLFNIDVSFVEMNEKIESVINNIFKIESSNDKPVSQTNYYNSLGNNKYCTDDGTVKMLANGEVFALSYQEEYKNIVGINYKNGVKALYTFIDEVTLSVGDILLKEEIIGCYRGESFTCVFKYNDSLIDYNEVIQML